MLNAGLHSVIPDFTAGGRKGYTHRALGFFDHPEIPWKADFSGVDYSVDDNGTILKVRYETSLGPVFTSITLDDDFFNSGRSIPDITDYAVNKPGDYCRIAEIFKKVKITPRPDRYTMQRNRVGNLGLAVAFISLAAGPYQHLMRDIRKMSDFYLDMYDCPELIDEAAEPLAEIYNALLESGRLSGAEVVLFGANYDEALTPPPLFTPKIKPWLQRAGTVLHQSGQLLLTHTDGENAGLMQEYTECGFDIADSVCPSPMTRLSLGEYRAAFAGKTAIWGGIPSSLLVPGAYPEDFFRREFTEIVNSAKPWDRLIFSIADTLPPDADFNRLLYIAETLDKV